MKTILLGYADVNGKGKSTILAGPEVPISEQITSITGIKASGKYPAGVVRVEFCELVARNTAVCVKANAELNADRQAGEASRIAALKKKDPVAKANAEVAELRGVLAAAAIARNELISQHAKAKAAGADGKELAKLADSVEAAKKEVTTLENKLHALTHPKPKK